MSDHPAHEIDLSNPEGVKERSKRVRLDERSRRDILKDIMSRPEGRKWVYSFLEFCHIFQTSFSTDPGIMAFREGERNVGLWLYADVDPDLYRVMMEERLDGTG